jgi:hypothetical protein
LMTFLLVQGPPVTRPTPEVATSRSTNSIRAAPPAQRTNASVGKGRDR